MTAVEVTVRATRYTVNAVPETVPGSAAWEIAVEYRGADRWAVKHGSRCLSRDGGWDYEPVPSERSEQWLAAHRMGLDAALEAAQAAAPDVTVMHHRAADVARRHREEQS